MKFAVGFQLYEGDAEPFSRVIELYRDKISEVFFAWQDIPTGRSGIASMHGYTDWTAQRRTEEELRKTLTLEQTKLFETHQQAQVEIEDMLHVQTFEQGFYIGVEFQKDFKGTDHLPEEE